MTEGGYLSGLPSDQVSEARRVAGGVSEFLAGSPGCLSKLRSSFRHSKLLSTVPRSLHPFYEEVLTPDGPVRICFQEYYAPEVLLGVRYDRRQVTDFGRLPGFLAAMFYSLFQVPLEDLPRFLCSFDEGTESDVLGRMMIEIRLMSGF